MYIWNHGYTADACGSELSLLRDVSSETVEKVPGLGDIPILGKFFQDRQRRRERDEIVFLITPHVIYPGQPPPSR